MVSTSIGIEGLEVEHGKHVLIADTPEDFAKQCMELIENPILRETLVENAYTLVKNKYSPARLASIMSQLYSQSDSPHC